VPRLVRFLSEFGAQSVPDGAESFVDTSRWPELDWEALAEHHRLEVDVMRTAFPPDRYATFGSWRRATQVHQATVLREHIEILRRLKYRPTGGFTFSWLADPAPLISASVLDHDRHPKLAWAAVSEACRPVIVVADPIPPELQPGGRLEFDVHVVNDLRIGVIDASVAITAAWRSGQRRWMFRGDVAADSCQLVGRVELDVPEAEGELLLGLALTGRDEKGNAVSSTRRAGTRIGA
jgi:beta-mannosidase